MEPNRIGYGGDLVADIVIVPYDDADAVEKAIEHAGAERVAGIFVEPVIGAGGVERIIEIDLDRSERAMFEKSVEAVRGLCEACTRIQPALG